MTRHDETLDHSVLQALPAHIAVLDGAGVVVAVNRAWTAFALHNQAGDNPSVAAGVNYLDVCRKAAAAHDRDAAQALAGIEAVRRGEIPQFSMEYPCHSPWEQRWYSMSAVALERGDQGGVVIAHFDISERKRVEENLRISEARSSGILRTAPVGIGVLVERVFQEVNPAMLAMTGYAREELIGQSARMLYCTEADFDYVGSEKYRQIRAQGFGAVISRWRRKDGRLIDVSLSSTAIETGDLSRGVAFAVQDITAQRQAEAERLIALERQRDTLVREVHHRIKNHLQGMLGLMRNIVAEHPEIAAPMDMVVARVRAIAQVYGLQSNRQDARVRFCDLLRTAAEDVVGPVVTRLPPPGVEAVLTPEEAVPLALVVNELISNAIKHLDPPDPLRPVQIRLDVGSGGARAEFRSAPAWLPAGFDFAQRRGIGTGLELVAALLPSRGATLHFRQDGDAVVAELTLMPPVILARGD